MLTESASNTPLSSYADNGLRLLALFGREAKLTAHDVVDFFVRDPELRFFRLIEPAAESRFIGFDHAIRADVRADVHFEFPADSKALTGPLAIGGAVHLALCANHVRACIRAVAGPKRADVMTLRHLGCFFEQVVQID